MPDMDYLSQCAVPTYGIILDKPITLTLDDLHNMVNDEFVKDKLLRRALFDQKTAWKACQMAMTRAGMDWRLAYTRENNRRCIAYMKKGVLPKLWTIDDCVKGPDALPQFKEDDS